MATNIVMVMAAIAVFAFSLQPKVLKSSRWRATVTPLASIIGSGFLVAGPILSHAMGNWAWLGMTFLCGVAYLFGVTIRRNIANVEPLLKDNPPRTLDLLERASNLALSFAYFISVAYYINLLAAFGLRGAGVIDETLTRVIATVIIGALGAIGFFRGLRHMENVELVAVGAKLSLIGAVIIALVWWATSSALHGGIHLPEIEHRTGYHELRVLLGLVILVQGFETSRYLGDAYDPAMRISSMRYAQWLSTVIYIVFILLMTPLFTGRLPPEGGETAIITLLKPVASYATPMIIVAALASQLSAAVADMNGAGGLLDNALPEKYAPRWGYLMTAVIAIAITWAANIFEIIVFASKAFVIYYALQATTAAYMARRRHKLFSWGVVIYALVAILAFAIVLLGAPAEGG